MAEQGEITGASVVLKFSPQDHRGGEFGDYKTNPTEALQAVIMMKNRLLGELVPLQSKSL